MMNLLISLGLGFAAAAIDVVPMVVRKLDSTFILSAFFMWIVLGILIPRTNLVPLSWLNGSLESILCVVPILCLVIKLDRDAIPAMIITSVILGGLIGFASGMLMK